MPPHSRTPPDPRPRIAGADPEDPTEVRLVDAPRRGERVRLDGHVVVVPGTDGCPVVEVDLEPCRPGPEAVVHARPGQVIRVIEATAGTRVLGLSVGPGLDRLFPAGWATPVVHPAGGIAAVAAVAGDLLDEAAADAPCPRAGAAGAAFVLHRVAAAAPPIPGGTSVQGLVLRSFLAEVEASFRTERSVAAHARAVGASTRTLARATAALLDRSPKDVIDRRVALEAARLLVTTSMPVTSVAVAVGFGEASNFTRFFTRRTGLAPLDFRSWAEGLAPVPSAAPGHPQRRSSIRSTAASPLRYDWSVQM